MFTTRNGLPHDHVRSVFQDVDDSGWVATFGGGLGRLENGRFTTLSRRDGLPHDRLYCVFRDRRGDLWIGTDGAGLVRRHDGRFTRYTTRDGLAHDNVRALYEDRQGSLWIGTSGGLSRLRDGRFTTYTRADGLPNDAVHAIHQDRSGALWLGTWGGGLGRGGLFYCEEIYPSLYANSFFAVSSPIRLRTVSTASNFERRSPYRDFGFCPVSRKVASEFSGSRRKIGLDPGVLRR